MQLLINPRSCAALLAVQLLVFSEAYSQNQSPWSFSAGLSIYNIYNEGSFSTSSALQAVQGMNMSPSFLVERDFNEKSSIGLRLELGAILAIGYLNDSPWLLSQRSLYQLMYKKRIKQTKLYYTFGLTAIDFKVLNYSSAFIGKQRIIDQFGPGIGIAIDLNTDYFFEIQNDIMWDFIQGEPYFFFGHLKLRLTKKLIDRKNSSSKKVKSNKWEPFLKFGFQFAYNHNRAYYSFLPYQQFHVFGEIDVENKRLGLTIFWRRSLWIDLEPLEWTAQSEYQVTNNFGVFYNPNSTKNHFGISYFNANESLMRQLLYETDSIVKESIYNMRGFSMHYERQLNGPLYFSSQVDFNLTKYSFMNNWFEFIRPRIGLAFKL